MLIPVLFVNKLSTEKCAALFISINNEQAKVPKSLIYDLYGIVNFGNQDVTINRATDIARYLNSDEQSPIAGWIKFPGKSRFRGGIQLSSIVTYLKPLVKPSGEFSKLIRFVNELK